MISVTSSPSSGTGNSAKGPMVVIDRHRLVVAGHHVDVVVRLLDDGALSTQVLEVGVGVVDEVLGKEEVDGFELLVAHWCSRVVEGWCPDRMGTKAGRARRGSVTPSMFSGRAGLVGDASSGRTGFVTRSRVPVERNRRT
jgi:hypothetical protein